MILRRGSLAREARSHLLWQLLVGGFGVLLLFVLVGRLSTAITPLVVALGLAYILDPPVSALARRGLPRSAAIVLLLLGALILIIGLALLVVPNVVVELARFGQRAPEYGEKLRDRLLPWIYGELHVARNPRLDLAVHALTARLTQLTEINEVALARLLLGSARGLAEVVTKLFSALLVPVFTFYFLRDFPSIERGAVSLVPPRARASVREVLHEIDRALHGWIRGELLVMACLGVYYSIGLALAGVDLAVPVGLLTGLLVVIPYIGIGIGLLCALVLAILHGGAGTLVGVLVVYGAGQLLEGLVLTPGLVGERVGLGPAHVLIAVLAGGTLLGFVGVLLAVPIAAVIRVVLIRARAGYERSEFYRGVPPDVPPGDTAEFFVVGRSIAVAAAQAAPRSRRDALETDLEGAPRRDPEGGANG